MPKLTETTNDKNEQKRHGRQPKAPAPNGGAMHITEAHEPLKNEPFGGLHGLPPLQPVPFVPQISGPSVTVPLYQVPVQSIPATAIEPQPLKIALVGTAPSSRMLAPYNDPSWKIWVCSPGNMNVLPRVDAWFEIHANLLWPENKHYGEPYIEWLKKQTFPIYMQDQSLVPNAIPLPKADLIRMFGKRCWTSSFGWMLAMAAMQGAKVVNLYGIDMASRDEYIQQRHGFNSLLDKVELMGIKVDAPYESDIMMPPALYGYAERNPFPRKMHARRKEIKERIAALENQEKQIHDNLIYLRGADEDMDYTLSIWSGVQDEL